MAKLTVIGSGDAFGSGGRFHTCFWLETGGKNILIDCGASAPMAIKNAGKSIRDIDAILITHFHGDHFGGLPFILTELAYVVRNTDHNIELFGPEGIKRRVLELQEAMYAGSSEYILPIITFHEYSGRDEIFNCKIKSYPVIHSELSNPMGIRIEFEGNSLAYSGDGEWSDSLIEMAHDADLMIIECYDYDKQTPGHMNYLTIEKNRSLLKCRKLYLTHHGPEMTGRAGELDIPSLSDGMEIEINPRI